MGTHVFRTASGARFHAEFDAHPVEDLSILHAATATAGAATLNTGSGTITSESLSTAAGAVYTLTVTNAQAKANSIVLASVCYGGSTTGSPAIMMVTPAAGSFVVKVQNIHASAALNGTIKVSYLLLN